MSWYDEMPPANSPAAIDKLFELASIPLGMLEVEYSDEWKAWLDEARKHVRHEPVSNEKAAQAAERRKLLRKLRATGGPLRQRACGVCGLVGHNKRSCPEATR